MRRRDHPLASSDRGDATTTCRGEEGSAAPADGTGRSPEEEDDFTIYSDAPEDEVDERPAAGREGGAVGRPGWGRRGRRSRPTTAERKENRPDGKKKSKIMMTKPDDDGKSKQRRMYDHFTPWRASKVF